MPSQSIGETLTIATDFSYSLNLSRPARSRTPEFHEGPTYSLPGFNSSLGTLSLMQLDAAGQRATELRHVIAEDTVSTGGNLAINLGNNNTWPGDSYLNIGGGTSAGGTGSTTYSDTSGFATSSQVNPTFFDPTDRDWQFSLGARSWVFAPRFNDDDSIDTTHSWSGTLAASYDFELGPATTDRSPQILNQIAPESGEPDQVVIHKELPVLGGPIGAIDGFFRDGSVFIQRSNGDIEPADIGTLVYSGDIIENRGFDESFIAFDGQPNAPVPGGQSVQVSPPPSQSGSWNWPGFGKIWQRGVEAITGKADDRFRAPDQDTVGRAAMNNGVSIGFSGTTRSPVGVNTFLSNPTENFGIAFTLAFLDPTGTFNVDFNGLNIFSLDASSLSPNELTEFSILGDFASPGELSELAFRYDAETGGNTFLLSDIFFNGEQLRDLTVFGRTGDGPVETALIGTQAQLDGLSLELQTSTVDVAPVPIGGTLLLLLSALGLAGLASRGRLRI